MLRSIAIDDEPIALEVVKSLSSKIAFIKLLECFTNAFKAIDFLQQEKVDLIFLDIKMPDISGIDFLKSLSNPPMLIFTTAYSEHAVQSFELDAIDYLLKPVDREELQNAVQKILKRSEMPAAEQLQILFQKLHHPAAAVTKIALPTMEGLQMIPVQSIISCEANDNYTTLVLKGNKKLVVSCTLKVIEEMLEEHSFVRVHRSFLVNLDEVEKYVKADGGYVVMSDGSHIFISRNKKEELLQKLLPNRE